MSVLKNCQKYKNVPTIDNYRNMDNTEPDLLFKKNQSN